jgi:hypothetical protein
VVSEQCYTSQCEKFKYSCHFVARRASTAMPLDLRGSPFGRAGICPACGRVGLVPMTACRPPTLVVGAEWRCVKGGGSCSFERFRPCRSGRTSARGPGFRDRWAATQHGGRSWHVAEGLLISGLDAGVHNEGLKALPLDRWHHHAADPGSGQGSLPAMKRSTPPR